MGFFNNPVKAIKKGVKHVVKEVKVKLKNQ